MKDLYLNIKTNSRALYLLYISTFLIFAIYFAVVGYKEDIPMYMLALHFYAFISYGVCLYLSTLKFSFPTLYSFVAIYTLVSMFILREYSWIYRGEPYLGGLDSWAYNDFAVGGMLQEMSFKDFIEYVLGKGFRHDDLGMFVLVYAVYTFCGSVELGQSLLLVVNVVVITYTVLRLNGLMLLLELPKESRKLAVVAYGCLPFLSLTAAVGLKENFFNCVIVCSLYYVYKYKENNGKSDLLLLILFVCLALFFRVAIFAMLTLIAIYALRTNEKYKSLWLYIMILGIAVGAYLLSNVVELISDKKLDDVVNTAEHRTGTIKVVGVNLAWQLQTLASFVGPFPNFSRCPNYAIVHSADLVLKMLVSYFFMSTIWKICRNFLYQYYPLLLFFLLHTTMVVLSGVAMDIRYQITIFPIVIVFVALGLGRKISILSFLVYIIMVFGLIYVYNMR